VIVSRDSQLQGLQRVGKLVARILVAMRAHAQPGMSTAELDEFGGQLLRQAGAISAPRSTYGFPGYTCISLNAEAAHGIPGARLLCANDLVNIDVSALLDSYVADTGGSFVLAPTATGNHLKQRLCEAALQARDAGIAAACAGQQLNFIGRRIERVIHSTGFSNVRNLCGHGVGGALHEEPTMRNYYDPRDNQCLQDGQVITIEPFLSTNVSRVRESSDGWTLVGRSSSLFAQFEHTLVVRQGAPLILTLP
jgi:methionyl aminopeptidase